MMMRSISSVPYFTSDKIISGITPFESSEMIRNAYLAHYDPISLPTKTVIGSQNDSFRAVVMPYMHESEDIYFEKVMLIERDARPGVHGYATMYQLSTRKPLAVVDATALTGIRTAGKSLLFSRLMFNGHGMAIPKSIYIYGSSTQAYYHGVFFSSYYPNASVFIICRSENSCSRMRNALNREGIECTVVRSDSDIEEDADVIITTTSSRTSIITEANMRSAMLMIAVGSSSGDISEIDKEVVAQCKHYIDSSVSIDGKGEYKLALDAGIIERKGITELRDVLLAGSAYLFDRSVPILFVSKGLIIEDYVFVRRLLGMD